MKELTSPTLTLLSLWPKRSVIIAMVALVICIVGAFFSPAQFFRAYYAAYLFFLGFPLGSLAIVMIYHLTGGAWGYLIRRIAEAQMRTLPLTAILFIPIVIGMKHIYQWANVETTGGAQSAVQELFLKPWFFVLRTIIYFAVWLVLTYFFSAWSKEQDRKGYLRAEWKASNLAGPGLFIFGLTFHFAAIDWVMSLQTSFTSTIFGPMVFTGQLLSAFALCVLVFCILLVKPAYRHVISPKVMNDLGSLLFTFLILWAYMVWFQFMLIWMANLPRGAIFYVTRSEAVSSWVVVLLVLFHFVIPFFLLLLKTVKRNRRWLGGVAGLLLLMQLLYVYYQTLPIFHAPGISQHWMDFFTPLAIGGLWLGCFLWLLQLRPILPLNDLNSEEAEHLRRLDDEEHAREEALAHG